jgi:basic amino acid/polyamine antiporter, APA family
LAVTPTNSAFSTRLSAPAPELQRQLGLASATAAVAGEAVAVGIFLTPAGMAKSLGSPLGLLIIWLAVGVMTLCGALCFGELAGRFPRTGGIYVYLEEAYGAGTAFLYGWMSLLVLDPGLSAALATGTAGYAAYIFPGWSRWTTKGVALALIWGICILNVISIRMSAGFLRWITWLKFGVLGALVLWTVVFHLGSWSNFVPFVAQHPGSLPLTTGIAVATVLAFFSFGGWWDVSKIAGELREPSRTLPRAMALGVLVVTAVYIVISGIFLYLVPLRKITSDQTFVAQAGAVLFGRTGGTIFAAIVVLCVLGSLAAFMMTAPRVYYAMAQDGLFVRAVARPHPRFGTPAAAIGVQAIAASLLIVFGNFQQIIAYFIFAAVVFLGLTVMGLTVVRRKQQKPEGVTLTPAYPATPIMFLLLVLVLLVLIAVRSPHEALLGSVVVLTGLPVYAMARHRTSRNG